MAGGGGLDDELLALAGGSARNIDLSSEEGDRVRTGSKRDSKPSTSSSSLAKKRRLDLLDESASGSDADTPGSDDDTAPASSDHERGGNPYPYQGIYKSARDMEELMSMNELEREDILAKRRDEINKRRQKVELAALVKAQKAAAGATKKAAGRKRVVRGGRRGDSDSESEGEEEEEEEEEDGDSDFVYGAVSAAKSRKKKLPGQTDAKSAKLSELRKKRKEKAAGIPRGGVDSDDDAPATTKSRNRRGYASSSASDVSYSDYSDEDDYPRRSRPSTTTTKPDVSRTDSSDPPSLTDLNAARITRDQIESRLYAPRWREHLTGSFFRFSWGQRPHPTNPTRTETVYRIHQVHQVVEKPGKFYDLSDDRSGKWCNVYLVFEHNGHEHEARINMLSRGEFVESERERWMAMLKGSKQKVPRKAVVARKADELERFFTSPLTEADIGKILEVKKRLRQEAITVMGGGGNTVVGATSGFDSPSGTGTLTPTFPPTGVKPQSLEAKLAAVNERNRALDRSKQSDVERKARKAAIAARSTTAHPPPPTQKPDGGVVNGAMKVTNDKVGDMGDGFVRVKNYSTLVEVDLGDF